MNIIQANIEHLGALAKLFDGYRQFYKQPSDLVGATQFLRRNIEDNESIIYLALDNNEAIGFVQLYPSWESVTMCKRWVLYDLYVCETGRKRGTGRQLMRRAKQLAKETDARFITLETAKDNLIGQSLYESEGYQQDQVFLSYSLEL